MAELDPLTTLIAAGPMAVEEVVRIGRDVAAAVTEVHGELWPSAIAVSSERVNILPAGLYERPRYGQYAAPERILGKPATPASDVFSIAAILFHALAGHPPFRGASAAEIMLSACTDAPLPLPPHVPRSLAIVIQRCLSRDPAERYSSPAALHEALGDVLPVSGGETWVGKRILAADDDAPLRELYGHVAARAGVEADIVPSGRDVIAALKTRRYDVLLMDLNMPRVSGWEVLDFLRSHYEARPRRLFVITGFNDQHISAADRDLVTAVLYKPAAADELRALLIACLQGGEVDLAGILRRTGHRIVAAA
jgi:CheY-like chemotaxis protein